MRWLATFAAIALGAGPAVADPKPQAKPDRADAKPAADGAKATPSGCKRKIVGRGLDRHVVCELAPVVVKSEAPKPNVVIVPRDGKSVTGRPRSTDPLVGLDRRLR